MFGRKAFDQLLYDDNDNRARNIVKQFFRGNVIDNPDKFGPDLIVNDKLFVEVEIKHNWDDNRCLSFPFGTVQLPYRKRKFLYYDKKIVFFVLSKTCNRAIIIYSKNLKEEYVKEVSNKYVKSGEYFYQIPLELCVVVESMKNKIYKRN